KRSRRAINHDNLCRRQCLETLYTNVTQAASSNHDCLCARIQQRRSLLYRVVCSEPCIGQSSNIFRLKARIQLDDCACARLQEVRHATIDANTRKCRVDTMHIIPCAAGPAEAAGDQWMNNDGISYSYIADRRPNLMHPAGIFMSQGVRKAHAGYLCPLSLDNM